MKVLGSLYAHESSKWFGGLFEEARCLKAHKFDTCVLLELDDEEIQKEKEDDGQDNTSR